jgi:hypothetical protein
MIRKLAFILIVVAFIVLWQARLGRRESHEGPATSALRAINTAQRAYAASAGHGGYALELKTLAVPCPGGGPSFLSPDLATDPALRGDYTITLHAGAGARPGPADCNGKATQTAYYVTAEPVTGSGSTRAFATDETGQIWYDTRGVAPTQPFREAGTVKRLE